MNTGSLLCQHLSTQYQDTAMYVHKFMYTLTLIEKHKKCTKSCSCNDTQEVGGVSLVKQLNGV